MASMSTLERLDTLLMELLDVDESPCIEEEEEEEEDMQLDDRLGRVIQSLEAEIATFVDERGMAADDAHVLSDLDGARGGSFDWMEVETEAATTESDAMSSSWYLHEADDQFNVVEYYNSFWCYNGEEPIGVADADAVDYGSLWE